jgi:MSHA biogenesis protein MshL
MMLAGRHLLVICLVSLVAACAAPQTAPSKLNESIAAALEEAATSRARKAAEVARVQEALLPPLKGELPTTPGRVIEPRFDLVVSNAPAQQVFMSIVSGTRYSMLVHPSVTGTISVNLKDVTVQNALDAIRELYGYDFKVDGTRIFIQPSSIQTRVFQVNYLVGQRTGNSDIRVTSGAAPDATAAPGSPAGAGGTSADSSRIQTAMQSDFWADLESTLSAMIGCPRRRGAAAASTTDIACSEGRNVIINPQAGVVVVRAMPVELRGIEAYLKAIRSSVERQVMLEAKIIEVTLNEQYQAGINWAAFPTSGISGGVVGPGVNLGTRGALSTPGLAADSGSRTLGSVAAAAGAAGSTLISGVPGGALIGLALQTQNFAAMMQFLESQGTVQVLSSPRVSAMNNQKAVLKVGTDDFFITNVSSPPATAAGAAPAFPNLTLRPFFTGVVLDVTPQIDSDSNIILHVRPSVSNVREQSRVVNLGERFGGSVTLPLASSTVSETDSIVKIQDGNIVAIGGLMKVDLNDNRSGLPGAQDGSAAASVFGNRMRTLVKKELVILIKPTVIQSDADSSDELRQVRDRIIEMIPAPAVAGGQK